MQTLLSLVLTATVAMLSTEVPVAAVPIMMQTVARAAHLFTVGEQAVEVALMWEQANHMEGVVVDGGHILLVRE